MTVTADTLIKDTNWGVRATNAFRGVGIDKVGQVMNMSDDELLRVPHLGRKSLNDIRKDIPEPKGSPFADSGHDEDMPRVKRCPFEGELRAFRQGNGAAPVLQQWRRGTFNGAFKWMSIPEVLGMPETKRAEIRAMIGGLESSLELVEGEADRKKIEGRIDALANKLRDE